VVDELTYGDFWRTIEDSSEKVALNIEITPELKKEGMMREIIRTINNLRKNSGLTISDQVNVYFQTDEKELKEVLTDKDFKSEILKKTISKDIIDGKKDLPAEFTTEAHIEDQKIWLGLEKL